MAIPAPVLGTLLLEDGRSFEGYTVGFDAGIVGGELCFNTGMTGYQEMFTDPSYKGQILIHNFVHLGNYGAKDADQESEKAQITGFVVRNFSEKHSRPMAEGSLADFLMRHQVMGIQGIDTRALVRHLRHAGAMNAALISASAGEDRTAVGRAFLNRLPSMAGLNLVDQVSTTNPYDLAPASGKALSGRVAVMDYGVKRNMLHHLTQRGCSLRVFPARSTFEEVMAFDPQGILLSNGPGDPSAMESEVAVVRQFLDKEIPLMGICLGHQLLARSVGLQTFKMHHGHRGSNHPVQNLRRQHSEITSQNHGFAVQGDFEAEFSEVELTHRNLNDGTVEGIALRRKPAFSVQYHPESNPGPHDSLYLFDEFVGTFAPKS
jgi:carbamoyl-phosphate synthase small subunit